MGFLKGLWRWFEHRTGVVEATKPMLEHPVPPGAATGLRSWMFVLGVLTMVSFVNQIVTGAMLTANYIPTPSHAYQTLVFITNDAPFGRMIRGMHFWGATAMVIFVSLHMLRVFLTGSYKFPREINWLTGVVLLGLTLGMAYTGQLLRWDENGVWSVAVATHFVGRVPLIGTELARFLLGGERVGGVTLSRFFAFHVFLFPAMLIGFIAAHLYLVLHHGISELPKRDEPIDPKTYEKRYERLMKRRGPPYWPDAAWKEALLTGALLAGIVIVAFIFGPRELGQPPDPTELIADPRPDWYFLWYYALLFVKPRGMEDLFMVYMPIAAGVILLLLPFVRGRGYRHPARRPWSIAAVVLIIGIFTWLTILGARAPWVPAFEAGPLPDQIVGVADGPVHAGAVLFHSKGCLACHAVSGIGGQYGPDLTTVGDRLGPNRLTTITLAGRGYMPGYAPILTPEETEALVAFMASRRVDPNRPPLSENSPLHWEPEPATK